MCGCMRCVCVVCVVWNVLAVLNTVKLMGLAVYNSTILDIHLPPCCYKKLLSPPTPPNRSKIGPVGVAEFGLHDLEQVMPVSDTLCRYGFIHARAHPHTHTHTHTHTPILPSHTLYR